MTTVLATGAFQIIHPGHILYLSEAKKLGSRLVVILARDKTIREQQRRLVIPEGQRLAVVKSLKPVDDAILGDEHDIFVPVEKIRPDIIALGPNQKSDTGFIEMELKRRGIIAEVVRINGFYDGEFNSTQKILGSLRDSLSEKRPGISKRS
ncbi:MAG: hypothetical protein MSIBF_02875 [Candidatus Altiarchaeales archaeon IMC4]|nr:MAG: hypothetical protein MSIBF_02875 [Candidatus Altiarchaeales archaeon IMC4]